MAEEKKGLERQVVTCRGLCQLGPLRMLDKQ